MRVINQLCDFGKITNVSKFFTEPYVNDSIYGTMIETAPDINETFAYCKLFGEWINCSEIFFPTLGQTGFCFTFNTVRLSEYVTDE